jgi:hypothetical protein
MKEKIKIFFLTFNWDRKQLILAVLILASLGLILPTHPAQAFAWLAGLIAAALIIIALQVLVAVTSGILWLATAILSWVTSENFISLPYTSGGVVAIGWPLCRDFANMAIVIFLVFIGLATALRIGDYQAKKTLPVLIIVALLINFSPVICGIFIDAANIVMNFFLEGIKEIDHIYAHFSRLGSEVQNALGEGGIVGFFELLASGLFIRPLVISFFNIGAAFIIFIFSFVFVLRYIALWALVILSPLAFASYILPITRRFWNMWWNQFIQWTIIGITMGFFLYLGWQIIGLIDQIPLATELPASTEAPNVVALLLNDILPYFVVLAFLALGFFLGLSSGAMGASQILTGARRGGQAAGAAIGAYAKRRTALWAKEKAGPIARRIGERLAKATPGEKVPGLRGRAAREVTRPAAWAIRGLGGVMIKPSESVREEIRKAEAEADKMRKETKITAYLATRSPSKKAGILGSAIKNLDQDYTLKELGEDEVLKTIKWAGEFQSHKKLLRGFPHLAEYVPEARKDAVDKMVKEAEGKGLTLKPEEIPEETIRRRAIEEAVVNITHHPEEKGQYVSGTSLKDERVLKYIAEYFDGRLLGGLAQQGGREVVNILQKIFEEIKDKEGNQGLDWFLKHNPAIPLYMAGNAAQDLGFTSFKGMTRDRMREMVSEARKEVREKERGEERRRPSAPPPPPSRKEERKKGPPEPSAGV